MKILGFTLIETLVAVTLLTIAVAGPMTVANRSIVAARISRDQLTASYLAQEGIEFVRAVRDNAYLALYPGGTSAAWNNFVTAVSSCRTAFCTLEPASGGSLSVCSGTCPPLWLSTSNTYTQTQAGTRTPFTRTIQVVDTTRAAEKSVISKVSWTYHGTTYSVTVSDNLTSWQ